MAGLLNMVLEDPVAAILDLATIFLVLVVMAQTRIQRWAAKQQLRRLMFLLLPWAQKL